ncbi:neprilysin-2 isoform X1 [Thrips palmi]|uniref:Neprilysin-2 isoform X1 n=1 Tax=Thrips palmi TaxID=161013 RepID=A0A6P8YIT7_THRPL|nr:neprilysin-2 isoform X1 [Thrips palmi]XP_034236597.1 neprilysin-2 isoform X1 [Thrips palmi]
MKNTVIKNPSWWKRRSRLERVLTAATACLMCVSVALVVSLAVVSVPEDSGWTGADASAPLSRVRRSPAAGGAADARSRGPGPTSKPIADASEKDVCLTEGCIHTASYLLKTMDLDVDPCDDFYQYACGNFIRTTNIPDDKTSITTFSKINDDLTEQLRNVIEEPMTAKDPKSFGVAKKLYQACMNKTLVEERGLTPTKEILKVLGGWPVLEKDWNEEAFDWKETTYKFRKEGFSVDYIFDFSINIDLKNSTFRVIDIDQASLGLSREYLHKGLEDKLVKEYYKYQTDIAVIFGADRAVAEKDMLDVVNFEIAMANISLPNEQRRNSTKLYNPMKISELQTRFPSIPWKEYMQRILPASITLTDDEVIIVDVPEFFAKLEKLLAATPKRTIANYLLWRACSSTLSYLHDSVRDRQLKFYTALSGRTERESRWKECVDLASGSMSLSIGSLYVRRYFREDSKREALEMVNNIRDEMYKILKSCTWMDDATRQEALNKAYAMTNHIAYPDELLDNAKLDKFYEGLEVNPDLYLESILNLTKFGTDYSFNRLRQKVNKTEWISHGRPAIVNAFYSSIENSIQFPAGILQGAFFKSDRPRYMNYGAIGFVIGHEITHGFDDQGRQFDKDGNLVDWWAKEVQKSYLEKARCIIEQYGNYTAKEVTLKLNGINTQGENIADNGGIKQAYRAYNTWSEQNGPEPRLPGLPLNPRQLFWVSAASSWCSKYRPEALRVRITTGYHSPGEFRVRGPMSNQEDFARDFNCPVGSPMNPAHKCQVW